MQLMFDNEQVVADWLSKKWGKPIPPWYFAIGILDYQGLLKGGISFHNYNEHNIEAFYYGPHTFTKSVMIGICIFLFEKIKVQRLTLSVPRRNKVLLKRIPKFGFKVEGVLRHFYGPYKNDDAIVFGLLASEGKKLYEPK